MKLISNVEKMYWNVIIFFQSSLTTNYLTEFHFEASVTVNVTAVLVMVTLFLGISQR